MLTTLPTGTAPDAGSRFFLYFMSGITDLAIAAACAGVIITQQGRWIGRLNVALIGSMAADRHHSGDIDVGGVLLALAMVALIWAAVYLIDLVAAFVVLRLTPRIARPWMRGLLIVAAAVGYLMYMRVLPAPDGFVQSTPRPAAAPGVSQGPAAKTFVKPPLYAEGNALEGATVGNGLDAPLKVQVISIATRGKFPDVTNSRCEWMREPVVIPPHSEVRLDPGHCHPDYFPDIVGVDVMSIDASTSTALPVLRLPPKVKPKK